MYIYYRGDVMPDIFSFQKIVQSVKFSMVGRFLMDLMSSWRRLMKSLPK